jgi:hypothetical protein
MSHSAFHRFPFFQWIILLVAAGLLPAATYYIRTDGGTAQQCTGLSNLAYSGTGEGQPCAWVHPFWALDESGAWRISGGDTLVIGPGDYMIGYGASNTSGWCDADGAFGCVLPPLPSGPSTSIRTRLLGSGWNTGCSAPPQFWGTQRAYQVLSLEGTSNADVECLEITDHSSCVEFHASPAAACQRDAYPFGDWAGVGIYATNSSRVTLRHLNVHGLANTCVWAGRMTDWTVEDVRTAGCGWAGWSGDVGDDSANSGTLTFSRWTVEWNGCAETYPEEQPDHCWGQSAGGYGDGVGFARSGGHWIIEDSVFRYNTSDGLDMLYVGVDHPDSQVELRRTRAYGNSGNQVKIGGASLLENVLAVGNCGYFYEKPFAQEMGDVDSGDHCRAGGAAVSINLGQGDSSTLMNGTVAGQGWAMIEAQCNTLDFPDQPPCGITETVAVKNGVFRGYEIFGRTDGRLADFIGDDDPSHFVTGHEDYNILYNLQNGLPPGTHDLTTDPVLVDETLETFDGHLLTGSPAIDSGTSQGAPDDDLEGRVRPQGAGVDRGAYESAGATEEYVYFIPAAARAQGDAGSNWVTDAMLHNPGGHGGSVTAYFTPLGADGTTTPYTHALSLAGGETAFGGNIVENWFGLTSSAGAVRIVSEVELRATSRTYNDQGANGTFGQFIPSFPQDSAIRSQEKAFLLSIQQTDRFRTNLGFAEASGTATEVKVSFFERDATLIRSTWLTVPPLSWIQKNLTELGITDLEEGYATVEVQGTGSMFVYASTVDWITSDAIFVPGRRASEVQQKTHQLLAVAARAQGAFGSNWKTDLRLLNPTLEEQEVTFTLHTQFNSFTNTMRIASRSMRTYIDAVTSLFPDSSGNISGSLHIESSHGLLIASRVYNDQEEEGTYGQYVPALADTDMLSPAAPGRLLQLSSTLNFRCNVGFTEYAGVDTQIRIDLIDLDGTVLKHAAYTIPALHNLQVDSIFQALGVNGNYPAARAAVTVHSGGSIYAYASVVDNTTSDAIFIPAQP